MKLYFSGDSINQSFTLKGIRKEVWYWQAPKTCSSRNSIQETYWSFCQDWIRTSGEAESSKNFGDRVISGETEHIWPACNQDLLSPCDYWLWEACLQEISKVKQRTLEYLKQVVSVYCEVISATRNTISRTKLCRYLTGDHFEHKLKQFKRQEAEE